MPSYKVPKPGTPGAPGAGRWNDGEFALICPALVDWLGDPKGEKGSVRETGTLFFFASGTWLKCCLTDRETGYRAFLTAATWSEMLVAIEDGLVNGTLDWRPEKPQEGKKQK